MADISAIKLPNGTTYNLKDTTARNAANSAVPNTRTVNGKALSSNISLGAGDVGAYTKSETDTKINAAVASTYKYKGSVTADKLPTSGQVVGDVYNITNDSSYGKAGMNVAWNGTTWDALGSNVDLSNYVTTSDSRLSNARPASDVYAWAKAASKPSYSASEIGAAPASHTHTKDQVGLGNVANLDQSKAIKSITRNGTTFTATALDGTTSTFTQQDSNTTYGIATSSTDGLMSAADKSKLDGIGAGANVKSVNGKTGAVSLSKADVGLGNVDNTSDVDKPYYKLIGQTERNTNKVGHFHFNDASRSLYKIKNFYAASGEGDYFYLLHKKSDYTITATKHFSDTANLFTADLSSDCTIATNLISESDPAILTIVREHNEIPTLADDLTLIFYEDMGRQSNARLKHWKLEIMTFTGKSWEWLTVFERTNVSDSINCLWCGLNPKDNWAYVRIKGIRITIYAATPYSTKSWEFGYNRLEIAGMRLLDSRPSFSPAEALGALDVAGGTVYGETKFQEGISATSYSGATATYSADGLMSKTDKAKLDGVADQASQLAKNTAQIETAGTATNAHSAGEYVMISNVLYKVTASVAKGDTWTIGTNVTAASVGNEISSLKSDLADKLYPVGSIYLSVIDIDPGTFIGGRWKRIKDCFLLAAGNKYPAGSAGGEAQHTLTVDEMPTHSHKTGIQSIAGGYIDGNTNAVVYFDPSGRATANSGGNQPHNNMPPYVAVYVWLRIDYSLDW